jgi:CheY-like chemotaxis protein
MGAQKPHILVVDDEKFSQNVVQTVLGEQGIEITCLDSGEAALDYLDAHPPVDLILLDLLMVGMDGYDVLQSIKRHPQWKDVNVIVMSGLDIPEEVEKAKTMGATSFIPKPVNANELKASIRAHLKGIGKTNG